MIRFLKKSLIFSLIFYGIFYYIIQINFFSFHSLKFDDVKKESQNYFLKLFAFLKESNFKKAFVLRDGEFLTYSDLKIQHIFDDKSVDLIKDMEKIYNFDCIISNNYNDPMFYTTELKNIINQHDKSTLVFDDLGYKVFDLASFVKKSDIEEFTFNVSKIDDTKKNYLYVTHKDEYPSLLSKPDINYIEFPVLDDGYYDCICEMEITADSDSIVFFSLINYGFLKNEFILKDTLYLKKGINNVSTRFIATHKSFRCLFSSKKNPILIKNFKIKFNKKENKKENKYFKLKQIYPKSYSMNMDNNFINYDSVFYFENKTNKEKLLKLKLEGDGELFLSILNFNLMSDKLFKKLFNNYLIKILSFFDNQNSIISIGHKSKIIEKIIPSNSILFLQFKKNRMNEDANFVIQNLEIINGSEFE